MTDALRGALSELEKAAWAHDWSRLQRARARVRDLAGVDLSDTLRKALAVGRRAVPICGDARCCASTDIADGITHGWGRLDAYGNWEHPCPDRRHVEQDRELQQHLDALAQERGL